MPRRGGGYDYDYGYGRSSPSTISELLMEGGRQRAEGAARMGDILSGTVGQLGESVGGIFEKRKADREAKAQEEALSKRDAAMMGALETYDGQDPATLGRRMIQIGGPAEAKKWMDAVGSFQSMTDRADEANMQHASKVGGFLAGLSPEGFARMYPMAGAKLKPLAAQLGAELPDDPIEAQQTIRAMVGYQAPKPERLTLGKGQKVVERAQGGDWQTVAEGMEEPEAEPKPPSVQQVGGRVMQFNPESGRYDIDLGASEAALTRAATAGKGRELKPILSGDIEDLATMRESLDLSKELLTAAKAGKLGAGSRLGTLAPDVVTEFTGIGAEAKGTQGLIKIAKQIIGKGLEGGVLRKEDEAKYEDILPKIGDAPEVAQAKIDSLIAKIEQKYNRRL